MRYLDYEKAKRMYHVAMKRIMLCLQAREQAMAGVLPSAQNFDGDRIKFGKSRRPIEEYMLEMERIDVRFADAKALLDEWERVLEKLRKDLKNSPDAYDRIYYYRKIEQKRPEWIAMQVGYSRSSVYRALNKIDTQIERLEDGTI